MTEPEPDSRICADCDDECPPEDVVAHPEVPGAFLSDPCLEEKAADYGVSEDDLDPRRRLRAPLLGERS